MQERLNVSAENLNFVCHTCELCNERGHLHLLCKLFHDRIVSKNCDDLISIAHYNELSLILGYEELKCLLKDLPEFSHKKFLDIDLEKIYLFCAENCIENPYIANYLKKRKQMEDDENDCNVISMNSLNIHSTNDDCSSHDENISFVHVNFCGVHVCKKHKYLETNRLQERLVKSANNLGYLSRCEFCNEQDHLHLQCKLFHD